MFLTCLTILVYSIMFSETVEMVRENTSKETEYREGGASRDRGRQVFADRDITTSYTSN